MERSIQRSSSLLLLFETELSSGRWIFRMLQIWFDAMDMHGVCPLAQMRLIFLHLWGHIYAGIHTHTLTYFEILSSIFLAAAVLSAIFRQFSKRKVSLFHFFSFIPSFFLSFVHLLLPLLLVRAFYSTFLFCLQFHRAYIFICACVSFIRSFAFVPFAIRNWERSIHFLVIVWCWCYCYYYYCRCCQRCCCCHSCCWYRSSLVIMGPKDQWQCTYVSHRWNIILYWFELFSFESLNAFWEVWSVYNRQQHTACVWVCVYMDGRLICKEKDKKS